MSGRTPLSLADLIAALSPEERKAYDHACAAAAREDANPRRLRGELARLAAPIARRLGCARDLGPVLEEFFQAYGLTLERPAPAPDAPRAADIAAFPYVIARTYADIDEPREQDPQQRFRQVIRTFSATLKFLALTLLAEYLQTSDRTDPATPEDGELRRFLSDPARLERPSLGHFAMLLELLVCATRERPSSLAGLHAALPALRAPIQELVEIRNIYVHSDFLPGEEELSTVFSRSRLTLDAMLAQLPWLTTGELVYLQGQQAFSCRQDLKPRSRAGLPDQDGVYWIRGTHEIRLWPLLLGHEEPGDPAGQVVLQYETLYGRRAKYLYRNRGEFLRNDDLLAELKRIAAVFAIGRTEERLVLGDGERAGELRWADILASARARSDAVIDHQASNGKYIHGRYAHRPVIEAAFRDFLGSGRRLMPVVGGSGCGKTNLLCHLTRALLAEGHAVLHYYGRQHDGTPFLRLLARDLVWKYDALARHLEDCGQLPEVRDQGRRLVVFVDAINEYSNPVALFDQICALARDERIPTWIKLVVTCRPLAWERIQHGLSLDLGVIHAPPGTRHHTLGRFTEPELRAAWALVQGEPERRWQLALPANLVPLLLEPILFHFAVRDLVYREKRMDKGEFLAVETPDAILDACFGHLEPALARDSVTQVVAAMWSCESDVLDEERVAVSREIAEWVAGDAEPDHVPTWGCEAHEKLPSSDLPNEVVVDDRGTPPCCPVCGRTMVVVDARPTLPTLLHLRDEGFLSLYRIDGGGELLRFTFDRMFEALTARHFLAVLDVAADPVVAIEAAIGRFQGVEAACALAAVRTAVLRMLQGRAERATTARRWLLVLGDRRPRTDVIAFLVELLTELGERNPMHAGEIAAELILRRGPSAWCQPRLSAGLAAGIEVHGRLVGGAFHDDIQARAPLVRTLVELACDPDLTVTRWEDLPAGVAEALATTSPNDACLQVLAQIAASDVRSDDPQRAVDMARDLLARLGSWGHILWRRERVRGVLEWFLRVLSAGVRSPALVRGLLAAGVAFLDRLPPFGPHGGFGSRLARKLLLPGVVYAVLLPLIRHRIHVLCESIPPRYRKNPESLPGLEDFLHLTADLAPAWERYCALYENLAEPLTVADADHLATSAERCFDEPFGGLLRPLGGGLLSARGMGDLDMLVEPAKCPFRDGTPLLFSWFASQLTWGVYHRKEPPTELQVRALEEGLWHHVGQDRARALMRYDVSGQLMATMVPLQVCDLLDPSGGMPITVAFSVRAAEREDWPLLARAWDQLLFVAVHDPNRVLAYASHILEAERDDLVLRLGIGSWKVSWRALAEDAVQMPGRRVATFDLDQASGLACALNHLLATIASLHLTAPRDVMAWGLRMGFTEPVLKQIRALADEATMRKIRDEKMLTYFANFCAREHPEVSALIARAMRLVLEQARQRRFERPTGWSIMRLGMRLLDEALGRLAGVGPADGRAP
ncbi:MAG: hypothetical protein ABIO70_28960 [Pseudomonadota bacterium]